MDSQNVDMKEFLAEPAIVTSDNSQNGKVTKTKRKRKTPYSKDGDPELQELRKTAKSFCSCYEQWRSISKYKKERLKDWVEQKNFDRDSQLKDNIFNFIHKAYAKIIDLTSKGDGHVRDHLENDVSLRGAIEDEGRDLIRFLNNKSKILMLSISDVYQGKVEQRIEEKKKPNIEIEIIDNGIGETEAETDKDYTGGGGDMDMEENVEQEEASEESSQIPSTDYIETTSDSDYGKEGEREDSIDG